MTLTPAVQLDCCFSQTLGGAGGRGSTWLTPLLFLSLSSVWNASAHRRRLILNWSVPFYFYSCSKKKSSGSFLFGGGPPEDGPLNDDTSHQHHWPEISWPGCKGTNGWWCVPSYLSRNLHLVNIPPSYLLLCGGKKCSLESFNLYLLPELSGAHNIKASHTLDSVCRLKRRVEE